MKVMKYVGIAILTAVMLPVVLVALLWLYDQPAEIRNMVCLVLAAVGLISAVAMMIREVRR